MTSLGCRRHQGVGRSSVQDVLELVSGPPTPPPAPSGADTISFPCGAAMQHSAPRQNPELSDGLLLMIEDPYFVCFFPRIRRGQSPAPTCPSVPCQRFPTLSGDAPRGVCSAVPRRGLSCVAVRFTSPREESVVAISSNMAKAVDAGPELTHTLLNWVELADEDLEVSSAPSARL